MFIEAPELVGVLCEVVAVKEAFVEVAVVAEVVEEVVETAKL
jgi:hypothetical protein